MEEEQLNQPDTEGIGESENPVDTGLSGDAPVPDPLPETPGQNEEPENPINTGLSGDTPDPENEKKENLTDENEIQSADEESDTGEGNVTNITIVRPPVQITYQADGDTTYHVDVENSTADPVPVLVTESLIGTEPELGIMEKKLADYTATEGLLLLILLTLWLRMLFDYLGRRNI